ncbi:hypothetical protein JCM19275_141 [Nonlabens ulvanivorans]|uniref:Uncharacterized protein n=1 Tax=Nonlabens ulvanivorans TaxID=906888 RepID=A0A081D970_NONUL|nr:hypothetical protein JCM19296_1058 [Nonlabens ulvanivorans]GAL75917.1 hypothetical protein JCM19275_141 [Nonlabens ulvanivorans]
MMFKKMSNYEFNNLNRLNCQIHNSNDNDYQTSNNLFQ